MQSNLAKIIFLVLVVAGGIGAYMLYNGGMFDTRKYKSEYVTYAKSEATIVDIEEVKRRKSNELTWTLEYKDYAGNLKKERITGESFMRKKVGDKIVIYYDSVANRLAVTEQRYKEIMRD